MLTIKIKPILDTQWIKRKEAKRTITTTKKPAERNSKKNKRTTKKTENNK